MRHEHSNLTDEALSMVAEHGPILAMKWLTDAVAKAEREACAKVCESLFDLDDDSCDEAEKCASSIRSRNNT